MSSPAKRLAVALRAITSDGRPEEVVALARAYDIPGRLARRAAAGMDVNASTYLKLCAAVGIDPIAESMTVAQRKLPDIDWSLVGLKVLARLIGTPEQPQNPKIAMRQAAKQWKLSLVTLARMKGGQPVGIDNLLKLCCALDCHPHEFLKRSPEMFHVSQQVERVENMGGGV